MTAETYAIQNYACPHCRAVFRTAFQRCPLDGHLLRELDGDPLAGSSFADRYIIEECVGEGGMGRVYRARHQRMSRRFAVKVLFGDHAADSKMQQRLAREAEAASRLSHPNVISVVDFGETDEGLLYLVMDYVEGPTLAQLIEREAPLHAERVIRITRDCARGLAHAHKKGLIHRDFKADNVLITSESGEEVAKIVDFGIAMLNEPSLSRKLTTEGMVLGTPAMMAPEQAVGERIDHRTDLFSLGIVLYEMLAGVLPFEGSPLEIARQNLVSPVPRIAARVPGLQVEPDLEALALALMSKRPEERPQRAKDVLASLSRIRGESSREFRVAEAGLFENTPVPGAPANKPWIGDDAPTEITPYPHLVQSAQPALTTTVTPSLRPKNQKGIYIAIVALAAALAAVVVAIAAGGGDVARAGAAIDAAVVASDPADAAVATIEPALAPDAAPVAPDAAPNPDSDLKARREADARKRARERQRERERRRRELEARRKAEAEARARAAAEITPAKYSATFRVVGRRLDRLARKDPKRARSLRAQYQIIQNQHALALGDEQLRTRNYRLLRSLDSKARRALKD